MAANLHSYGFIVFARVLATRQGKPFDLNRPEENQVQRKSVWIVGVPLIRQGTGLKWLSCPHGRNK
jgi:hypothetical protein